jgi:hypothetical protein
MINRTNEIKRIIKENGYTSYLEIGLGNGANFKEIVCDEKVGIDPESVIDMAGVFRMTSDEWFTDSHGFDLIFIDGLHHADQVERDIINSWNVLNKGGQILIHDVKPLNEVCQRVPREQTQWTGDVWRSWYGLKNTYPKLKFDYLDERVGLAIIHKSRHKIESGFTDFETDYEIYNNLKGWEV